MRMNKPNWPSKDEVEHFRWTNNHSNYHSFGYGFCEAQDSCDLCDYRIRVLCRMRTWIIEIRDKIIRKHYGVKGW